MRQRGVPNIKVEPGTGKETLQREAERCADQLQKKAEEDQVSSEKTSEEATSRGLGISNQEQQGKDAGIGLPCCYGNGSNKFGWQ